MKKALSLILALVLSMSLCACSGDNNESKEPVETISIESLLNDTNNGAKAELNVGKGTTIYGKITNISSSDCTVALIYPKGSVVSLEMPIEQLAELKPNQFIAVDGIVASYNSKYTITATTLLDLELMDSYIKEKIATTVSAREFIDFSGDTNAGMLLASFQSQYNIDILEDYVFSRGKAFMITDDTQLEDYLIGNWVYFQSFNGLNTLTLEYKTDGTSVWHYGEIGDKHEQHDDWSVKNGKVDSIWRSPENVYVLNEDVFLIHDYYVYIKIK